MKNKLGYSMLLLGILLLIIPFILEPLETLIMFLTYFGILLIILPFFIIFILKLSKEI